MSRHNYRRPPSWQPYLPRDGSRDAMGPTTSWFWLAGRPDFLVEAKNEHAARERLKESWSTTIMRESDWVENLIATNVGPYRPHTTSKSVILERQTGSVSAVTYLRDTVVFIPLKGIMTTVQPIPRQE